MAERTVRTDIIIAIHPEHVSNIVSRVKDHEFRKYLIPSSVLRIWIYETSPASAIKYVAKIGPGKRPGEITNTLGLRNAEFNEGKLGHTAKYAYEIQNLLAIPSPWTLQDLKAKGWLNGPPQKYCYVKESMMSALHNDSLFKVFDSLTSPDVCDRDLGEESGSHCDRSDERPLEPKVVKSRGLGQRRHAVRKSGSKLIRAVEKPGKIVKSTDRKNTPLTNWFEGRGRDQL